MTHLNDEELRGLVDPNGHLASCASCRLRRESWHRLSGAAHDVSGVLAGDSTPPAFDVLLPDLVPPAVPVRRWSLTRSGRTTALLVLRQVRLVPWALLPLSLVGFVVAVAISLFISDDALAERSFAAGVVLVTMTGSMTIFTRRTDPRTELLCALPVSPVVVFTARLVVVLAVDLLLALAGSIVVHSAGIGTGVFDVVAGWLGQSLLASAIAVVCTVRYSRGVGAAAAVAVWFTGSVTTLSRGGLAERVGAVAAHLWATTPWTAALALGLFVLAVRQVGWLPERRREFA